MVLQIDYLKNLSTEIRNINAKNGWNLFTEEQWESNTEIPAIIALIHSELSESLEAFRENDKEHFLEEMADVVIRVLNLTGGFKNDFEKIILDKLEKNRNRPYKHGGKRI